MRLNTTIKTIFVGLFMIGAQLASSSGAAAGQVSQGGEHGACSGPIGGLPATRAEARQIVAQIRADLAAVENDIRNTPFIGAVVAGAASVEQIAAIAAEEYSIIRSDMDSFARMASHWDKRRGSHFFGDLAYGEQLSMPLLLRFAANVGLDEASLAAYEPRPKGQTYPSRVAWIANNADRASAAASFLVNFAVFGENMGRIRDALVKVYGFAPVQIEFFSFFADPIPGFEDAAIEVIANGLLEGACAKDIHRSARLLQAYELDFWQAASDQPGSPLPVIWPPAH
jgi:hypothetical protein